MQVKRASGARVNGLIDFTSGWLVANIGHDNRAVMRAVRKAHGWAVLDRWENPARTEAKAAILSTLPSYLSHIAFYNSGSEAIDAAIRLAGGDVTAHPLAFHGSTIGAQSIRRGDFTHLSSVPVMLSPFLGAWCEWPSTEVLIALGNHNAPIIVDEMQSGVGRTGAWWGFEHMGIEPDLLVGGKAIAGGFPMGFVAGRSELMDGQNTWESTFSGNALSCAACVATIREIRRRKLIERVVQFEPLIQEAFPQAQGKGFAYAFDQPHADDVVDRALERGLMLLHTGRGTIKIAPPLCIRKRDLIRGLEILRSAI